MRCGKPIKRAGARYCRDCAGTEAPYEQGRSLWVHKSPVSDAIYRLKYKNKRYYGRIFAREMADRFEAQIRRWGIEEIVPIPLYRRRYRARGYNQAAVIARELGKLLSVPVREKAVLRVRSTKPQKDLGREQRLENLRGAFAVSKGFRPKRNILLIDDIYTTGSTICRAAEVLRLAGAEKVYFLTISIGQAL